MLKVIFMYLSTAADIKQSYKRELKHSVISA